MLSLPALRIAEDHSENAAAPKAGLIQQHGPVKLTQFAGDEQAEPRTSLPSGEKGFEDAVRRLRFDAGSAVGHLEIWTVARTQSAQADLGFDPVARLAVFDGVVAQVPHYLVQVTGIKTDLKFARRVVHADLVERNLHCFGEFGQELLQPIAERQARRPVDSRRESCRTLLMMVLTRSELLRMISVRRRSPALTFGLSANS